MATLPNGSPHAAFRALALVAAIALVVPSAWAVSLFDIIQLTKKGYGDDQIAAIIEATTSRFEVDADTIVTLKNEGVHEKVIQAVVAASDGPPAAYRVDDSRPATDVEEPSLDYDVQLATSASPRTNVPKLGPPASFSVFPIVETAAAKARHEAIALGDIPIVILRSRAGFLTIAERARAAAAALNRCAASGGSLQAAGRSVVLSTADGREVEVLKVAAADVVGLQKRSGGPITAEQVAEYWAALLADYVDLALGVEPAHLARFGILSVQRLSREVGRTAALILSPDVLSDAVDHLPGEDRRKLIDLAAHIPSPFRPPEAHHEIR